MKKIAIALSLSLVLASNVSAATPKSAPRSVTPIERFTRAVKKFLGSVMLNDAAEIKPTITIP